jgi:hypothetical protein
MKSIKTVVISLALGVFFFCCDLNAEKETFADIVKPIKPEYLYKLYDKHKGMHTLLDTMFSVKRCYNVKRCRHKRIMSYSLFWKAPYIHMTQPEVSSNTIYQACQTVKGGESFYSVYVEPLIDQLSQFKRFYPGWTARVYLSSDLEFLVPKLTAKNVEIFVMHHNSIAAAPGSMWRFLVFDDPSVDIAYVKDADKIWERLDGNFSQAEHIHAWINSSETKGFFRLRDLHFAARRWIPKFGWYSPISASSFGAKRVDWINMEKAMKGYILHRLLFPAEKRHPQDCALVNHPYGFGHEFPNYGFDESFLKHVLYFAAADRNELVLLPTGRLVRKGKNLPANSLPLLDLEYTKFATFKKPNPAA